jgi:hypothetical protein
MDGGDVGQLLMLNFKRCGNGRALRIFPVLGL